MDLDTRIRTLSASLGADYFGIADLAAADGAIRAQGGGEISRYPRAVVIGISLLDDLVDLLPLQETRTAILYRHHAYDVVNAALDQITLRLAVTLQKEGYRALPVPASRRTDDERICGIFSHKLAAHLAGLGWIGKSCLLITPEHGPRVRWSSVLTDAPLAATESPMAEQCGECCECIKVCPVQAFTGRPFSAGESRETRFDAAACDRHFRELEEHHGVPVCGLCLWICPRGRRSPPGDDFPQSRGI
jgi:epoxyqueuosine reductase